MKFGNQFEFHKIPEWYTEYLDYQKFKELIKAFKSRLKSKCDALTSQIEKCRNLEDSIILLTISEFAGWTSTTDSEISRYTGRSAMLDPTLILKAVLHWSSNSVERCRRMIPTW